MIRTTLITTLTASALITATTQAVPLELAHQGRILDKGVNLDGTGHFKFAIVDYDQNLNRGATARATVSGGRVVSIAVLDGGLGYVTAPNVRITPISRGSGAAASARIAGGRVTSITVSRGGSGYLGAPRISLDAPTGPPTIPSIWSHDGTSAMGDEPTGSLSLPVNKGLFSLGLGDLGVPGMTEALTAATLAGDDLRLRTWFSASGDPGTFEQLSPDHKVVSVPYAIRAEVAQSVPDGAIGVDQIANGAITGDKIANGTITNANIAAPGFEKILVSDGNGNSVWMTAGEFLLSQGYTPSLPGIVENLCPLEIEGVMTDTVQIVNGPGLQIEDLGGNPGESGLNTEFAIVFDYDGPANQDLQDWLATPVPRAGSIIVEDGAGTEFFRWNYFEYELTSIVVGGGNNGKNRYTMNHTLVPNNTVSILRSNGDWPANEDRREGDDIRVEIEGVIFDVWPVVVDDPVAKTLTMTFDYNEGGGIWEWARQIAQDGTFNRGRKVLSLIYEGNRGLEIGRNNYFECFPIRYQHFTGFDLVTKGKEQVVISYDFARNADNGNDPLFVPPVIEFSPGTPLMEVPYNLATNELAWEIDGVQTNQVIAPGEVPVLLSGPGWEIERIAGFDGQGNPDDQSGSTREFPLVVEVGGQDLVELTAWRNDYVLSLPLNAVPKAISLILKDASDTETFRWNCFEMIPFDVTPLPSGRGRVTIYHNRPPDNIVWYEFNDPQDWPDALQNNPATDTEVEIEGITTVFAEVAVDPATRTLTLTFDFGEGGSIIGWATGIGEMGTSTLGKKSVHLADGGLGTNYLGCFPIAFQHFTGFEQDVKGKAKVVLSYDTTAPATQ